MKILNFNYIKEDTEKAVKLFVKKETDTNVLGIDITKLTEEEKIELKTLSDNYFEQMKKFNKAYRNYSKFKCKNIEESIL